MTVISLARADTNEMYLIQSCEPRMGSGAVMRRDSCVEFVAI